MLKKLNAGFSSRFYSQSLDDSPETEALASTYNVKTQLVHKRADELALSLDDVEDYLRRVVPL